MQSDQLYEQLKDFLQQEPACTKTLGCLKPQAQIGIVIGGSLQVCVQNSSDQIRVEKTSCLYPDFIFYATPRAVEVMIAEKSMSPAQLGVKFLKQVLTQQVTLAMPGHLFQIMRKGYFDMLTVGGKEFITELKKYNLASVSKIIQALVTLKKK